MLRQHKGDQPKCTHQKCTVKKQKFLNSRAEFNRKELLVCVLIDIQVIERYVHLANTDNKQLEHLTEQAQQSRPHKR